MKLIELLQGTGIACPPEWAETEISGISYDSRKTKSGDLFVCVKGFQADGHRFAEAAVRAGASAVLAQDRLDLPVPVVYTEDSRRALSSVSANYYGHASDEMLVFGITGTNGKTTITYLLRGIVEAWGKECAVLGTIAYIYGGQTRESANTTPESCELQRMFREMRDEYGIEVCAMEVSSHSLALDRSADIRFDCSIFTNLTPDHMDFHKDFEDYYQAKKRLFHQTSGACVINIDDEYGRRLYGELLAEGRRVRSCGVDAEDADYRAVILKTSAAGTDVELYRDGTLLGELNIRTPGRFSVSNAICAAAASLEEGIPWECVRAGIGRVKGVPGRFELVENVGNIPVIVDYAHTPDALEKVLRTAREFTTGRIITVFGCGGDRDRSKRPLMGETAGRLSDICVVTSDNPRTEDPDAIIEEILPGIEKTGCSYMVKSDRWKAIRQAIFRWKKGDTIILAGKGHEDYQIIGTEKQHFDDREMAARIIEQEIDYL